MKHNQFFRRVCAIFLACALFAPSVEAPPRKRFSGVRNGYNKDRGYENDDYYSHADMMQVRLDQAKRMREMRFDLEKQVQQINSAVRLLNKAKYSEIEDDLKLSKPAAKDTAELKRQINALRSADTYEEFQALGIPVDEITAEQYRVKRLSKLAQLDDQVRALEAESAQERSEYDEKLKELNENPELAALRSLATETDFTDAQRLRKEALEGRITALKARMGELDHYDSTTNSLLRAFLPDYVGGSVSSPLEKGLLAVGVPVLSSLRNSLDDELDKVTGSLIKRLFRSFRDGFVSLGWTSPLPLERVTSWLKMVKSYQESMKKLSTASSDDTAVAGAFNARLANRIDKPGQPTGPKQSDAGNALVDAVNSDKEDDEMTAFIKQAEPVYLRVSEAFVRQMRSQISVVNQKMNGQKYQEQREVLNDLLKMLDSVGYMVGAAHRHYRQPSLTQSLNRDLMACCDWLVAQLHMLHDLISVSSDKEETSSSSSSSALNRKTTTGYDF